MAVAQARTSSLEALMAKIAGDKSGKSILVVLDSVQDPGNLGSIIRSALAFDAKGIILSRGTVDPYNAKVVRAAMGALFDLPVVVDSDLVDTLKLLKTAGFALCSLNPEAQTCLTGDLQKPWPDKIALILGNEGAGLSPEATALADLDLKIEISPRIESLNVSIAAAIVLFQLAKVAKPSLKQD